jgi:ankyrin repeat protein
MTIEEMKLESDLTLVNYAMDGKLDGVKRAINEGVDVNTASLSTNPLREATIRGHIDIVSFLLKQENLDVNLRDEYEGINALHAAAIYTSKVDNLDMLKLLLDDERVDLDSKVGTGITEGFAAIHLAAYLGATNAVDLFLKSGSSLDNLTATGLTVLDVAGESPDCDEENIKIIQAISELSKLEQMAM